MGLDINFYKESKLDPRYSENVGYFRKVNFILTYFNVDDDMNCKHVYITKEQFKKFIFDLKAETDNINFNDEDNLNNIIPKNEKLKTKQVFFGGSLDYNKYYWQDIVRVHDWANEVLNNIDWDKDNLYLVAWW